MRFKFVYQLESNDCGPACLAMVGYFHGVEYDIKSIKEFCAITRMGVSVKDILQGGRNMGFNSVGLKLTTDELSKIPLPAILFWKQDHFVVLYKIERIKNKQIFFIADPGYGKVKLDTELLEREWLGYNTKGIVLVFEPSEGPLEKLKYGKTRRFNLSTLTKYILSFAAKHKIKYLLSLLLLLIGLTANWLLPIVFKKTIDNGIVAKSISMVWVLLLAQFVLFLGNFFSQLISDLILTKFNFALSVLLKENFLKKLIKLPVNYFDTRLNTDTLQRLSDLSKIQSFLTWKGIGFFINILNILVFSYILFSLNRIVFLLFLVLSIVSIVWVGYFLKKRAALEYSMFIQQSDNSNGIYEFIMNMPEIKVNQAQKTIINKITSIQKKLNALELRSLHLNMYQLSGANFILKLKDLLIIAICAYLIINSKMTIGTLLSITYIMGQLSNPIINIINNLQDAQSANISNKRVEDVYSVKDEALERTYDTKELNIVNGIRLQSVSFKYPGSFNPFILKNISIDIFKNKVTAIVGSSGSGKSTLLKLLMLYYSPNNGDIFLDNKLLKNVHPDLWRSKCGVVLQDGHIFSGTLSFNVSLCESNEIDFNRLINAVKIACIDQFIDGLPMKFNTKVGNVGMQLSGGQIQRILIARAVYKDPEFVFFDEATSSLDANNEREIMNNLDTFFSGKTVVVVAHRLSTVKNADQIIVLENGEVIERGTHAELVFQRNKYYALVKNQLELGN